MCYKYQNRAAELPLFCTLFYMEREFVHDCSLSPLLYIPASPMHGWVILYVMKGKHWKIMLCAEIHCNRCCGTCRINWLLIALNDGEAEGRIAQRVRIRYGDLSGPVQLTVV